MSKNIAVSSSADSNVAVSWLMSKVPPMIPSNCSVSKPVCLETRMKR